MAQFWASNCEYEINENRDAQTDAFNTVGQSMAATSSYTVNYTTLIRTWYQAGQYYDYYSGYCTDADGDEDEDGELCGPYIQVSQFTFVHYKQGLLLLQHLEDKKKF